MNFSVSSKKNSVLKKLSRSVKLWKMQKRKARKPTRHLKTPKDSKRKPRKRCAMPTTTRTKRGLSLKQTLPPLKQNFVRLRLTTPKLILMKSFVILRKAIKKGKKEELPASLLRRPKLIV